MSIVDESGWIAICPRCKDASPNNQIPVSRNYPCPWCGKDPYKHPTYKDRKGKTTIMYYRCQPCGIRYLRPRFETPEQERLRLAREIHRAKERMKGMSPSLWTRIKRWFKRPKELEE